jgi:hypothetical protein
MRCRPARSSAVRKRLRSWSPSRCSPVVVSPGTEGGRANDEESAMPPGKAHLAEQRTGRRAHLLLSGLRENTGQAATANGWLRGPDAARRARRALLAGLHRGPGAALRRAAAAPTLSGMRSGFWEQARPVNSTFKRIDVAPFGGAQDALRAVDPTPRSFCRSAPCSRRVRCTPGARSRGALGLDPPRSPLVERGRGDGPGRDRTYDLRIMSPLL